MEEICAIAKDKAGGPTALAKTLGGITPQAVSLWKKVPVDRVIDVERITGISRHKLRPDIFGPAPVEGDAA
ncbi:Cro/CI family transcriptional regulator [Mesorhizobium sp. Z1-4]|uniref:transcriptional regulator n=1 Tax=Mesorhizobium sp. Z1-4 TaxID=2448478 RepID=UPI000FDCD0B2|nr:Cro/CI family transcriptional regulator [Mesorhizobium sp. Z1-4]